MQNAKICSFFGHRDTSTKVFEVLYREVVTAITNHNISVFYAGNHGAFDSLARQAVAKAKAKAEFPFIESYMVLAYLPTKKGKILEQNCDGTIYPDGLELAPKRFAISHRNKWIVQQSDMVIGYVRTSYGGAYEALHYAKNQKKLVVNLADTEKI